MAEQRKPFVLHTRVVTGTGGGPEKTILNSPRFLRRHGIDSACLFMRPADDPGFASLRNKASEAKAPIFGVDDHGPFDMNVFRQCLRICRERRVDVWHAHDYKSNAIGLALSRFHPMHLVTTAHGWVRFTSRTPLYYRIDKFCLKHYQQVICVSEDLYEQCQKFGVRPDRLSLIDNAIIADDYNPAPATAEEKRSLGFEPDTLLIGACGRLSEEKGFQQLIDAVGRLIAAGHSIGLVIAGEGHLKDSLLNQIQSLGLSDRIRLTGFLEDPRQLYRAIDVFVLSSLREGLPNVVLEAMASQRAVVTTRVNGIPRLVQSGENGIIVEADNIDALYRGLEVCLRDRTLREDIAAQGRATVENEFSFDRRMEKVVAVYRSLSGEIAMKIGTSVSHRNAAKREPIAT
ncbi:MAG: hypothetical protein Fues2KO_03210 [Fuerstiella sp.]